MIHIDWLTVSQLHADAPEWGSVRRLDFDMKTGEIEIERVLSDTVQASWDTSLRVRSTGGRVEVSGNPSKWGRLDAVTGLTDLWSCVELYNGVLSALGLPSFSPGWYLRSTQGETFYPGPTISRVDLTRNLVVGRGGVRPFLDWIEAQVWGKRLAFRRIGENTLGAGKRNRRQRVLYDKAAEIAANKSAWKRSRAFEREDAVLYLDRLAAWAESIGLVRDEIRLGSKFFNEQLQYRLAESWSHETPEKLFNAQSEIQTLEAGVMNDYRTGIYDLLTAKGYSARMAGQLQKLVHSWLHGDEWKLGLTTPTAYRYASILRKECGLDLRKPSNIRSLSVCVKPKVLEARPLTCADLPDWYDQASFRQAA